MAKKKEENPAGIQTIKVKERRREENETDEHYAENCRRITVTKDLGADLQGSVEMFGEAVIHQDFLVAETIAIQDMVRPMLKAGKTDEEIHEAVERFVPGTRQRGRKKSDYDKTKDAWSKLSKEERDQLLAELMSE